MHSNTKERKPRAGAQPRAPQAASRNGPLPAPPNATGDSGEGPPRSSSATSLSADAADASKQLEGSPVPDVYVRKYGRPGTTGGMSPSPSFTTAKGPDGSKKGFRVARAGFVPGPEVEPEPEPAPDMTPLPPLPPQVAMPTGGSFTTPSPHQQQQPSPQDQRNDQRNDQQQQYPQQQRHEQRNEQQQQQQYQQQQQQPQQQPQQRQQYQQQQQQQQQQQFHFQQQQMQMQQQQQRQFASPSGHTPPCYPPQEDVGQRDSGSGRAKRGGRTGGGGSGSLRGSGQGPMTESYSQQHYQGHVQILSNKGGVGRTMGITPHVQLPHAAPGDESKHVQHSHVFNPSAAVFTPGMSSSFTGSSLSSSYSAPATMLMGNMSYRSDPPYPDHNSTAATPHAIAHAVRSFNMYDQRQAGTPPPYPMMSPHSFSGGQQYGLAAGGPHGGGGNLGGVGMGPYGGAMMPPFGMPEPHRAQTAGGGMSGPSHVGNRAGGGGGRGGGGR